MILKDRHKKRSPKNCVGLRSNDHLSGVQMIIENKNKVIYKRRDNEEYLK